MKRTTIIFMIFSTAITLTFLEGVGIWRMKMFYIIWGILAFRYVSKD